MPRPPLTRRHFLAAAVAPTFAQPRRPNILVFMTDQESALLPGPADLPNRRRLHHDAVRFSLAFSNTPQCSAARSSLLTGLEPHQTGVRTNVDATSLGTPLSPAIPNVGSVFSSAGYRTGYFGKWHLGGARDSFGFATIGREQPDDEVAREAAAWIARQQSPWLAWVSVLNPHNIYSIPRALASVKPRAGVRPPFRDLRNLAGKPAEQQAYADHDQGRQTRDFTPEDWLCYRTYYLELVEKADANLGTVLAAVKDLDATLLVYTSDHGDALGEHGLPYKGPFMYEEEIRVPLLIRAPGRLPAGERDDLVVQVDLAPTLAALARVEWPAKVAGRNLAAPAPPRDAVFLEYYAKQKWVNPIRTIRERRWKLNQYQSGHRELYDLQNDPHEIRNLATEPAAQDVRHRLNQRLDRWWPA